MRSNTSIADGTEFRFVQNILTKKTTHGLFDYYEMRSAINGYEDGFLRVRQGTTKKDLEVILRTLPAQVDNLPEV